ncbi:MAG: hypothetical protein PHR06_08455, partial [Candidatus Cloacimonetes bacterium]|nr:hypothetical protein [Candidatus Cloacimonadota bacterium]
FTDDGGESGAGATYVCWSGNGFGEPGDGYEAENDDDDATGNGGATEDGAFFPAPYVDCVIINEYEADPEIPDRDVGQWVELLVIAEGGVDLRNWLLTDINPSDLYNGITMPPGLNEAFIRFNDYSEFSNIPGGTTIVIFDGNGLNNDLDSSDGTMFIYTESEYLSRVPLSFWTIQLDILNDNLTLWADDDGIWDVENSTPIDHISWGTPRIEAPYGLEWRQSIQDSREHRTISSAYFSAGDDTINDDSAHWVTDGSTTQGILNPGQSYSGSGWQPEPTNHVLNFSATAITYNQIDLSWTENDGSQPPQGYLVKASIGYVNDPTDSYEPPADADLSDGEGVITVNYGISSFSFTTCNPLTTYNFKIYPFTGSGNLTNYKLDGDIPEYSTTTPSDIFEPTPGDLLITEVVGKDATIYEFSGFIEFTNITEHKISLSNVTVRYYDGSSTPTATFALSGIIEPNDYLVICQNETYFPLAYNMTADFILPFNYSTWPWTPFFSLDGGQDAIDFYHDSVRSEIIDQFNNPTAAWNWNSDDVLERVADTPGTAQSDWSNPGGIGSPGEGHFQSLSEPQNVVITIETGIVTITWDSVTGAASYNIYSCTAPDGTFELLDTTNLTTWQEALSSEEKKFYRVTAVE